MVFIKHSISLLMLMLLAGVTPVAAGAQAATDVIARVGDETVSMSEIDTLINSSSVIGMAVPPPGTAERNTLRLEVLDKLISANLLYLDALENDVDENPVYRSDVERYEESALAALYRERRMSDGVSVSDDEVKAYFEENVTPGTAFTPDLREAIAAALRKDKYERAERSMRTSLREGVAVVIHEGRINPDGDVGRDSATVIATLDGAELTWGEVRRALTTAPDGDRLEVLERLIDRRIMLVRARAAGLEQDPRYRGQVEEFRKARLINMHRAALVAEMEPTPDEITDYFQENRGRISVPEQRRIQMIVVESREEAAELKAALEAGELTMHEAAGGASIAPNAGKTLGEMGWVAEGSGFPRLDRLTFSLEPGVVGGPVRSPAGWHLVKVQEIAPARFQDIDDKETRKMARRLLLRDRRDSYVVDLRRESFEVRVYQDVIRGIMAAEAQRAGRSEGGAARAVMEGRTVAEVR